MTIKWEIQRVKDETDASDTSAGTGYQSGMKRPGSSMDMGGSDSKRRPSGGGPGNVKVPQLSGATSDAAAAAAAAAARPLDKVHCDAIVNCLLRLACQVNNAQAPTGVSPLELLSRYVP